MVCRCNIRSVIYNWYIFRACCSVKRHKSAAHIQCRLISRCGYLDFIARFNELVNKSLLLGFFSGHKCFISHHADEFSFFLSGLAFVRRQHRLVISVVCERGFSKFISVVAAAKHDQRLMYHYQRPLGRFYCISSAHNMRTC